MWPRRWSGLALRHPRMSPRLRGARTRIDRRRRIVLAAPAWPGRGEAAVVLDLAARRPRGEDLVGRFTVDGLVVFAGQRARLDDGQPLGLRRRTDPATRRRDEAALDRLRHALGIEARHQRFAHAELDDGAGRIELLVRPERL